MKFDLNKYHSLNNPSLVSGGFKHLFCFFFLWICLGFESSRLYSQTTGSMFTFDGIDDRVTIPAHPSYAIGSGNFTIEFWMKLDGPYSGSDGVIFSMQDSATRNGVSIVASSNWVTLYIKNGLIAHGYYAMPLGSLYNGNCYHYAFVRSGNLIKVYVDGALANTFTITAALNISSYDILFGGSKNYGASSSPFKGALRDFRIWSIPLSQFQILNRLRNTTNSQLTNLIGAWKLNGNFKQKVEDVSMIQNHGNRGSTAASETADPSAIFGCPDCIMHSVQLSVLTSTAVCAGDSASLKVPLLPGETCLWFKNGVLINGAVDSVYKASNSGIYSAKVFNSSGCFVYSNPITVKKLLEEIGNISCNSCYGVNSKFCWWQGRNDTLTMPVYGGYTYKWYKDSVLIPGAISHKLPISAPGKYYCTVEANGCTKSSNIASYFSLDANISAVTSPQTCLDTLVTLRVNQNMYHSPQYQWKVNNSLISGATSSQITTSLTGGIHCTVRDSMICPSQVNSATIYVNHGVAPDLYISYNDELNTGVRIYSDCSFLGGGVLKLVDSYNIEYSDAGLISTSWGGHPTIFPITPTLVPISFTADYIVSYTSACGTGSNNAQVLFAGLGADKPAIVGMLGSCNPITLSVEDPFLDWSACQWYKDGSPIAGAVFNSYVATESGDYSYALWNDCDSIMSDLKHVSVNSNINITAPDGTIVCPGVSKKLVASNSVGCQWKLNGVNIPGAIGGIYMATTSGNYTCQLTNSCGTFLSNAITITSGTSISPAPGTLSGPTGICQATGNSVYSVLPVVGATSYTWVFTNGPTILTNPDSNAVMVSFPSNFSGGKVVVYANNSCSSFKLDSLMLSSLTLSSPTAISGITHGSCGLSALFACSYVQNATSYNWVVPPGVLVTSGQGTINAALSFPATAGTDTIKVNASNSCMSSSYVSKVVQRVPNPASTISGPTYVCAFQTGLYYSIAPVTGATGYLWTLPVGASITNGQSTATIQMTMGGSTGYVVVAGVNSCGTGQSTYKWVGVVCREEEELPVPQALSTAPNPFDEYFTLQISGNTPVRSQGLIINTLGQVVERFEMIDGSADMLGQNLDAGFYILQVETERGVLTSKITKN